MDAHNILQAKSSEDEPDAPPVGLTQTGVDALHAEIVSETILGATENGFEPISLQAKERGDPENAVVVQPKHHESLQYQGDSNSTPYLSIDACSNIRNKDDLTRGGHEDGVLGETGTLTTSNETTPSALNIVGDEDDRNGVSHRDEDTQKRGHLDDSLDETGSIISSDTLESVQYEQVSNDDKTRRGGGNRLPGDTSMLMSSACDNLLNEDDRTTGDYRENLSGEIMFSRSSESIGGRETTEMNEDDRTRGAHGDCLPNDIDFVMSCSQNTNCAFESNNNSGNKMREARVDLPVETRLLAISDLYMTPETIQDEQISSRTGNWDDITLVTLQERQAVDNTYDCGKVTPASLQNKHLFDVEDDVERTSLRGLEHDNQQLANRLSRSGPDEPPVAVVDDVDKTPPKSLQDIKQQFMNDGDKIPPRCLEDVQVGDMMDGRHSSASKILCDKQAADSKDNETLEILQDKQLVHLADISVKVQVMQEAVIAEHMKNPVMTTYDSLQNEQLLDMVDDNNMSPKNLQAMQQIQVNCDDQMPPMSVQDGQPGDMLHDVSMIPLTSLRHKEALDMMDGGGDNFSTVNLQDKQLVDNNDNRKQEVSQDKQLVDMADSSIKIHDVQVLDLAESHKKANCRASDSLRDEQLVDIVSSEKMPLRSLQDNQPEGMVDAVDAMPLRQLGDKHDEYYCATASLRDTDNSNGMETPKDLQNKQLVDVQVLDLAESLKKPNCRASDSLRDEQFVDIVSARKMPLMSLQGSQSEGMVDDVDVMPVRQLEDKRDEYYCATASLQATDDSNGMETPNDYKQLDDVQVLNLAERLKKPNCRASDSLRDEQLVDIVSAGKMPLRILQGNQSEEMVDYVDVMPVRQLEDKHDEYFCATASLQDTNDSNGVETPKDLENKQLVDLVDSSATMQHMQAVGMANNHNSAYKTISSSFQEGQLGNMVDNSERTCQKSLQAKQQTSILVDTHQKTIPRSVQDIQLVKTLDDVNMTFSKNSQDKFVADMVDRQCNTTSTNVRKDEQVFDSDTNITSEDLQSVDLVDTPATQSEHTSSPGSMHDKHLVSGIDDCDKVPCSGVQGKQQISMVSNSGDKSSPRSLQIQCMDVLSDTDITSLGTLQGEEAIGMADENMQDKQLIEPINLQNEQTIDVKEHFYNCEKITSNNQVVDMVKDVKKIPVEGPQDILTADIEVDGYDNMPSKRFQAEHAVDTSDDVNIPVSRSLQKEQIGNMGNGSDKNLESLQDKELDELVDCIPKVQAIHVVDMAETAGSLDNPEKTTSGGLVDRRLDSVLDDGDEKPLQSLHDKQSLNAVVDGDLKTPLQNQDEQPMNGVDAANIMTPSTLKDNQLVDIVDQGHDLSLKSCQDEQEVVMQDVASETLKDKPSVVLEPVSHESETYGAFVIGNMNADACVTGGKIDLAFQDGKNFVSNNFVLEKGMDTSKISVSATMDDKSGKEFDLHIEEYLEKSHHRQFCPTEQSIVVTTSPKESWTPVKSSQGDRKRAAEHMAPEQRRTRSRRHLVYHPPPKEEEDVCFVCFDGGNLILCDKKSCPKAYHVECTGRESDFFQKKGQWFCGWHVCAYCSRSASSRCYTCPSAYCSNCIKASNFVSIRKDQGLCEGCYPIVRMIEQNKTVNADGVQVDFNDKETYEYLFKVYWEDLKQKITLTSGEFEKACKAKETGRSVGEDIEHVPGDEEAVSSDSGSRPRTRSSSRLLKRKRMTQASIVDDASGSEYEGKEGEDEDDGGADDDDEEEDAHKPRRGHRKTQRFDGWASRELLEFLKSMKEDSKKSHSLLAVKNLLWCYVEKNKLFNPRRRGQVLCDERLQKLFGRKNVGRFEMLKLLSSHIAARGSVKSWNYDSDKDDDNGGGKSGEKCSKFKKKSYEGHSKPDPSEYAAVDVKNLNLIYVKRSLLEDLRGNTDFENKIVGSFVRIRVPGIVNKNDTCYRLVKVIGIKRNQAKPSEVILEIMNLQKREEVMANEISNQDFTEEECQRLQQTIKYGVLKPMTVGELEEKAQALRESKVKDWFETELLRLSHLRDRASEIGHKRELRECVERIQLLNSQEERERQLISPLEIKADPRMDPSYESDDQDVPPEDYQEGLEMASSFKSWEKSNNTENHILGNAEPKVKSRTEESKSKTFKKEYRSGSADESQKEGWNPAVANSRQSKTGLEDNVGNLELNNGWSNKEGGDDGWGDKQGGDGGWGDKQGSTERRTWGKFDGKNAGGGDWIDGINSIDKHTSWGSSREETGRGWGNTIGNMQRNPVWSHQGISDQGVSGDWGENVSNTGKNRGGQREGGAWTDVRGTERKVGWVSEHERSFGRSGCEAGSVASLERNPGWTNPLAMPRREGNLEKGRTVFSTTTRSEIEAADWKGRRDHRVGANLPGLAHAVPAASTIVESSSTKLVDHEKVWFYQDPTKAIQGPFSIEQLRKWEKTKLFPLNLRVWRTPESPNASILLTDLLGGKLVSSTSSAPPHVQAGWEMVAAPRERDFRSSVVPNSVGNEWGAKGVLEYVGPVSKASEGGAWSGGWGAAGNPSNYKWPSENVWGPKGPGKPHQGNRDACWQGGEVAFRDSGHHNDHRFGRQDNGGWGARPHNSWGRVELPPPGRTAPLKGRMGSRGGNLPFPTPKKDCPCTYFERGMCRKGQFCEFRH